MDSKRRKEVLDAQSALLSKTSQNFQSTGYPGDRAGLEIRRTLVVMGRNTNHTLSRDGQPTQEKYKAKASVFTAGDDVIILPVGDINLLSIDHTSRLLGEPDQKKLKQALRVRNSDPINRIA